MRLLVWNINALQPTVPNFALTYSREAKGPLLGFFRHHDADVVCLQEHKLVEERLTRELACVEGYESFWAVAQQPKGRSGVVTYVREAFSPLSAKLDALGGAHEVFNREGRTVQVDLGPFVLINVYVPNGGGDTYEGENSRRAVKKRFLRALKQEADALVAAGREVLIVGDINTAAGQQDVHAGLDYARMYDPEDKALLGALLGAYTDVWRRLHPHVATQFSVWDERTNKRPFNQGVRIDYALATPGLVAKVVSCEFLDMPPKWSDHDAFLLELRDIEAPGPHPPCPESSRRHPRFAAGRSLKAMFQAQRSAAQQQQAQAEQGPQQAAAGDEQKAGETTAGAAKGSPTAEERTPAVAGPAAQAACQPAADAADGGNGEPFGAGGKEEEPEAGPSAAGSPAAATAAGAAALRSPGESSADKAAAALGGEGPVGSPSAEGREEAGVKQATSAAQPGGVEGGAKGAGGKKAGQQQGALSLFSTGSRKRGSSGASGKSDRKQQKLDAFLKKPK